MKKIKGKHILIICPGKSILTYKEKIDDFIKNNEIVMIGCKNMGHMFVPDYHVWTDNRGYNSLGKNMSKNTMPVFSTLMTEKIIKKHWKKKYIVIDYTPRKWKPSYEDIDSHKYGMGEVKCKNNKMYGALTTTGCVSVFWAHMKGAYKISIIGMDGYTLYSLEELKSMNETQHCYGRGFSDLIAFKRKQSGLSNKKIKKIYENHIRRDKDVSKTLLSMKKYKVNFEIITPTVFKDYYNPNVLDIE